MINTARRILIKVGQMIPFILCLVLLISYIESTIAALQDNYIDYGGDIYLNTPISFYIASLFEYDLLIVFLAIIVSIAIEACIWNRLSIFYITLHFFVKQYIDFELEIPQIINICIINILISGFFVYKGLKILINK